MKTIFTFIISIIYLSLSAQEIESLYDGPTYAESNKYYKDLYNDLDRFVGTWLFTNGNTSLTITLQKKVRMQDGNFFEDVLVGGYKYVVNGLTVVNTLPLLSNNYSQQQKYTLFGNTIIGPSSILCINCTPTTRRVSLSFWEPDRDVWNMNPMMEFERADEGTIQKLSLVFYNSGTATANSLNGSEPEFHTHSIPIGNYTLTRQ
jgi:hypothetical protein